MPMPLVASSYDRRLARRVLLEERDAVEAAVTLFERREPASLEEAVGLLEAYGEQVTAAAFEHAAEAWNVYWHLRDMPED
jgi:hypothetical protein